MQIVIDIDEEEYNIIKNFNAPMTWAEHLIAAGTPLPDGCDIQRIIPKRVDVQKWIYTKCPNPDCNHMLSTHYGDGYYIFEHQPDFCPDCGQALLWESEDKE